MITLKVTLHGIRRVSFNLKLVLNGVKTGVKTGVHEHHGDEFRRPPDSESVKLWFLYIVSWGDVLSDSFQLGMTW